MAVELSPPADLEQIGQLQRQLQAACRELAVEEMLAEAVQAAGVAAWSALVLAEAQGLTLTLERQSAGISLCLGFDTAGGETPAGLAAPLFCPPARQAGLGWRQGRQVFEVQWDE